MVLRAALVLLVASLEGCGAPDLLPDLDHRKRGAITAYQLRAFEEKPDATRAVQLLNEPGVAWNAGMVSGLRRRASTGGTAGASSHRSP